MFKSRVARRVVIGVGFLMLLPIYHRVLQGQQTGTGVAGRPERFALLVGVDKYADPRWDTLRGPGNDVGLMEELLASYDFPKDAAKPDQEKHIRTLIGSRATRQAILEAFRSQLIQKAKGLPNAIAVFYFSGHGSHVEDKSGTNGGDRMTLAPSDRDTAGDISDEELYGLVAELTRNTKNVILILDACYSGAATRALDPNLHAKEVPPVPMRRSATSRANILPNSTAPSNLGFFPLNEAYAALYSSLRYEKSHETDLPVEGGGKKRYGVFTYHLVKALQLNPTLTYGEAAEAVADVIDRRYSQHPVAEASVGRPVFGGPGPIADAFLRIISGPTTGRSFTIQGGSLLGLQRGGFVAVYAPTARKLIGDADKLANARIVRVDDVTATAELMTSPNKPIPNNAKVALIAPNFGTEKLRVFLPSPSANNSKEEKAFLEAIGTRLTDNPIIAAFSAIGPPPSSWDVAVQRGCRGGQDGDMPTRTEPQSAPCSMSQESVYLLVTPTQNTPLFGLSRSLTAQGAEDLALAIENYGKQKNILALTNSTSPFKGKIQLRLLKIEAEVGPDGQPRPAMVTGTRGEQRPRKTTPMPTSSTVFMHIGDFFQIEVVNTSDRNLDFALLALETDGGVKILTSRGAGHEVQPNKPYQTPTIYVLNPPAGLTSYKVIAYLHPRDQDRSPDFGVLELPGVPPEERSKSALDPLSWLVTTAATGSRTTDVAPTVIPSSWAVAQVSVLTAK